MMTADLHYLTISELAPMIERKEISPVEVTRHMLDRIERIDGDLRAYARLMGVDVHGEQNRKPYLPHQ